MWQCCYFEDINPLLKHSELCSDLGYHNLIPDLSMNITTSNHLSSKTLNDAHEFPANVSERVMWTSDS